MEFQSREAIRRSVEINRKLGQILAEMCSYKSLKRVKFVKTQLTKAILKALEVLSLPERLP